MKAVLIQSEERFEPFLRKMRSAGVEVQVLDFQDQDWVGYDYSSFDFLIYYPSFVYSSNHPLALNTVHDNLLHIHETYPSLEMYPDPDLIKFYNDKYRQYLYLSTHNFPIPKTIPLFSLQSVELADRELGYPMVVKNRFGAGGASVFKISNKKELEGFYRLSQFDFAHTGALVYFFNILKKRIFYYHLLKARKMNYPFLSSPLLAQEFISTTRDLKTVMRNGEIVEGHWRYQASPEQWKVNIDGGGIGEWSHIPEDAIHVSEQLAEALDASWLNIDLMPTDKGFLISEFSPVWHHYKYKEKPTFVYKDDYNIALPLETSLDLENIILDSFLYCQRKE